MPRCRKESNCAYPQSGMKEQKMAEKIENAEQVRWQGMCGLANQTFCTCEPIIEDNCNKLSGWEGHHMSLPAHLHHTTTTAVMGNTSGIPHGHNSNSSQCSKSNSKHQPRTLITTYTPDIPFNMTEISLNGCYRGLEHSSAHIEHYLSSYTYPHLEHMLAESLKVKRRVLCSTCGVTGASRLRDERRVKLSTIRVQGVLEDSTHHHNPHWPHKYHRSICQKLTGVQSTHSVLHVHPNPPPNLNITTTSSNRDTGHTVTMRPHRQQQKTCNSTSLPSKTDSITAVSYNTAKHVYDMGVRWTPRTFPSFVISAPTGAMSKPLHRTVTKKKTPVSQTTESVGKNGTRVSMPLPCGVSMHVRSKKGRTRKCEKTGHKDSVSLRAVVTKTLSPFPIVSLTTASTTAIPPIPPVLQNQGLLATRREFSHLLRHKKCENFHSGIQRSNFHYDSLCLEGHSATTNSRRATSCDGNNCSDTVSESGLRANSLVNSKIPGPWIK